MAISQDQIDTVYGAEVVDRDGATVGTVSQVYVDDVTEQPSWVTVTTGQPGEKEAFVPLTDASLDSGVVTLPYPRALIAAAPGVDADGDLTGAEQDELFRYYEAGRDTGDDGMIVRDEQVDVGTERVPTERVRLRKHVVTEMRTVTVPVEREKVELVEEPVDPALGENEKRAEP